MMTATFDDLPKLTFEVVYQISADLNLEGPPKTDFEERLREIGASYFTGRMLERFQGNPKEQRQKLQKLVRSISLVLDALGSLSPEHNQAVSYIGGQLEPDEHDLDPSECAAVLMKWGIGANLLLQNLETPMGRPTDVPLERAVRAVLALFDDKLGLAVKVAMRKHSGRGPTAATDGAHAIVRFLRSLPEAPTETAILSMINKVRRSPKSAQSDLDRLEAARLNENWREELAAWMTKRH